MPDFKRVQKLPNGLFGKIRPIIANELFLHFMDNFA
jgi:hypothetical protein